MRIRRSATSIDAPRAGVLAALARRLARDPDADAATAWSVGRLRAVLGAEAIVALCVKDRALVAIGAAGARHLLALSRLGALPETPDALPSDASVVGVPVDDAPQGTLALVPLHGREARGALAAWRSHPWTPADRALLAAAAELVGSARDRALAIAELHAEAAHARALVAIVRAGERHDDPFEVAQEVAQLACSACEMDLAVLVTVRGERLVGTVAASEAPVPRDTRRLINRGVPRGEGLAWKALQADEPAYAEDYAALPEAIPAFVAVGVRSFSVVPLASGHLLLCGVRLHRVAPWTARQREVLAVAAGTVTRALERHAYRHQLEAAALCDPLTTLGNRRALERELDRQVVARPGERREVALLFVDVDGLKRVNDAEGHARGDELLRETARALRAGFRGSDRVYRIGGDEFAVLLPGAAWDTQAAIRGRLEGAAARVARAFPGAGLSAGIAFFPDEAEDAQALLRLGDARMYAEKRAREGDRARRAEEALAPRLDRVV